MSTTTTPTVTQLMEAVQDWSRAVLDWRTLAPSYEEGAKVLSERRARSVIGGRVALEAARWGRTDDIVGPATRTWAEAQVQREEAAEAADRAASTAARDQSDRAWETLSQVFRSILHDAPAHAVGALGRVTTLVYLARQERDASPLLTGTEAACLREALAAVGLPVIQPEAADAVMDRTSPPEAGWEAHAHDWAWACQVLAGPRD